MYVNDLWISDEAIERVTVSGPALELRLTWRWEELPLLLDLPSQLTLRWDHVQHDDPHAGVPIELIGWDAECVASPLVAVTLRLEREVQGTGSRRDGTWDPMTLARELEPHDGRPAADKP